MRKLTYVFVLIGAVLAYSCNDPKNKKDSDNAVHQTADATIKPNIIYILADDLGYGELGVYGQEKSRPQTSMRSPKTECCFPLLALNVIKLRGFQTASF